MFDLKIYLKLGWRNLWLHPMRTGLTIAALALGIAALTFLSAMNDGWMQQIKTNFALTLMGHIQIHADGYEQSRKLADRIKAPAMLTEELKSHPMVAGWTQRVRVSGLASAAGANAGVLVYAIEPERERVLSRLINFVQQGRWLTQQDNHAVLLGDGLADHLQVGLGNKIVLMAALPNGDIASEVFRVRGILHSGVMDIDNLAAVIPLSAAQKWLDLDKAVTDVVVFTHDFDSVQPLATKLRQKFSSKGMEVLSWSDIDPMAEQWSQFADAYTWIILGVVILVVLAEVLNTMLMSMHERTRELGLMGALGVTSRQIFAMIIWETLILVFIGSVAGFALGGWASVYFGAQGIDLSRFAVAFSFFYMDSVVHPALSVESVIRILGAAIVGAIVSGLFPAWKAAKLDPAVAMREV